MVLDAVRMIARSFTAGLLAKAAMKLDPDAASDAIRTPLGELVGEDRAQEIDGYDGPVVTPEARAMIEPRMRLVDPEPEEFPLVGSIAERRGAR
jgi:hypothetical protein